jgi:probable rRNA maturation factor
MSAIGPPRLRVVVFDGRGRRLFRRGLTRWLSDTAPARARGQLVVALVCDAKMRGLNRDFRGIDRPTDVLSFPTDPSVHPPAGEERLLGDVAIATGVAERQARRLGHTLDTELRRLALHGLLHVLGYDHERDDGRMERLERRLLRKGGLAEAIT